MFHIFVKDPEFSENKRNENYVTCVSLHIFYIILSAKWPYLGTY
jgi:hypothetical protein